MAAAKAEISKMQEAQIVEKRRVEYQLTAVENKADTRIKRAEARALEARQEAEGYRAERDIYKSRCDWLETFKVAVEEMNKLSLAVLGTK